jgi:hypothetical protein
MPLEEVFVDRDVLMGDQPPPRLVLGNRVDEHRGMAVAETVQECGDIEFRHCEKNTRLGGLKAKTAG